MRRGFNPKPCPLAMKIGRQSLYDNFGDRLGYAIFSDHIHTPALLQSRAGQLFDGVGDGALKVKIGGIYPLANAAQAHADMESRTSTGKLLFIP